MTVKELEIKRNAIKEKYGTNSKEYRRVSAKIFQTKHKKKYAARMEKYRLKNLEYQSFRVLKNIYLKKTRKPKGELLLLTYILKDMKVREQFLEKL